MLGHAKNNMCCQPHDKMASPGVSVLFHRVDEINIKISPKEIALPVAAAWYLSPTCGALQVLRTATKSPIKFNLHFISF
jgi:hypothetical protein